MKDTEEEKYLGDLISSDGRNANKNARRPEEAHIAKNLKGIKILDRAGEDLKELAQH